MRRGRGRMLVRGSGRGCRLRVRNAHCGGGVGWGPGGWRLGGFGVWWRLRRTRLRGWRKSESSS